MARAQQTSLRRLRGAWPGEWSSRPLARGEWHHGAGIAQRRCEPSPSMGAARGATKPDARLSQLTLWLLAWSLASQELQEVHLSYSI